MNLTGRKVQMFRCHIDPMIGPKPANAFSTQKDAHTPPWIDVTLLPQGVYVKVLATGIEHLVPYANVQSLKLLPEKVEEKAKAETKVQEAA